MAASEQYFVEWKEHYVSKERGNRVVHYFLKDNSGESILAVVGTERSVRHMFYVVSEEFLSVNGAENSVHSGFRWRSRREVVNWLTSMLSKQHVQVENEMSPKDDPTAEVNGELTQIPSHKGRLARNLKGHNIGITWSGSAWSCGKQLKHYPAFCRNGVSIAVHSFVFVMAEKENRYIAYLEDMYEDKKSQKKVKVRWFHHNKEVKGVVSLRNSHPKEVFITPYVQVISAECVDGPAIVLTRQHFEKCLAVFPHDLLQRMHFCFRQFKNTRVKPFKVCKLKGYLDQPIFSCFSPDFFEEELSSEDDVRTGNKRNRNCKEGHDLSCKKLKYGPSAREFEDSTGPAFKVNSKVEFLCQDSGIRGCWFRCTVLEISKKQMKVLYDDVKDDDSHTNLEEWIPTYRVAKSDKLGMRHLGRPTVRPICPLNQHSLTFEVGDPADAWWSDGWWEGVIYGINDAKNCTYQIYVPGENLYLDVELKNLRVSRDWIGGQWVDIEPNPNILDVISPNSTDTKVSTSSAVSQVTKSDNSPTSCHDKVFATHKLSTVEEEIHDLADMTLTNVPLETGYENNEARQVLESANEQDEKEQVTADDDDDDDDDNETKCDDNVNNETKCEEETINIVTKC